jgi:hypothetical protein
MCLPKKNLLLHTLPTDLNDSLQTDSHNLLLHNTKVNHPMELHLVHFNSLYGSNLSEAMNTSTAYDTIAVLSVIFEIQKEDNPDMKPITDGTVVIGSRIVLPIRYCIQF